VRFVAVAGLAVGMVAVPRNGGVAFRGIEVAVMVFAWL
jgi:hypothetical protein